MKKVTLSDIMDVAWWVAFVSWLIILIAVLFAYAVRGVMSDRLKIAPPAFSHKCPTCVQCHKDPENDIKPDRGGWVPK